MEYIDRIPNCITTETYIANLETHPPVQSSSPDNPLKK